MLHVIFALDSITDVREVLIPKESLKPVAVASLRSAAAFSNPTRKIIRYANIERAVGPIGDDINPSTVHGISLDRVDGRNKSTAVRFKYLSS